MSEKHRHLFGTAGAQISLCWMPTRTRQTWLESCWALSLLLWKLIEQRQEWRKKKKFTHHANCRVVLVESNCANALQHLGALCSFSHMRTSLVRARVSKQASPSVFTPVLSTRCAERRAHTLTSWYIDGFDSEGMVKDNSLLFPSLSTISCNIQEINFIRGKCNWPDHPLYFFFFYAKLSSCCWIAGRGAKINNKKLLADREGEKKIYIKT